MKLQIINTLDEDDEIRCNLCGEILKNNSACNEYGECWECVQYQDDAEYSDDIYYTDY